MFILVSNVSTSISWAIIVLQRNSSQQSPTQTFYSVYSLNLLLHVLNGSYLLNMEAQMNLNLNFNQQFYCKFTRLMTERLKIIAYLERKNPCGDLRCGPGEQCIISEDGQGYLSGHCICPKVCDNFGDSVESTPLCSTDGTDFPTLCHLRVHACKTKRNITVKYYGKCGALFLFEISIWIIIT